MIKTRKEMTSACTYVPRNTKHGTRKTNLRKACAISKHPLIVMEWKAYMKDSNYI